MAQTRVPDQEIWRLIEQYGIAETRRRTGYGERRLHARRRTLEKKYGRPLRTPNAHMGVGPLYAREEHPGRINLTIKNGTVLVGGDNHYWPGKPSLMHRAFVRRCKETKPAAVILNGDVTDLGLLSKHDRIGWEELPEVADEIEAGKDRLGEIENAAFRARKIWTLGNHDARFNTRLATVAPEYAKLHGTKLRDHFPLWEPAWRCDINKDIIIKHRGKGGKHSAYNNTLHAGKTMITGHDHCPYVRGITDARGTRWAVNHGCIADPDHEAFLNYTEDSPFKDWRAAFVELTFVDGKLLQPELWLQWDEDHVQFRGEIIRV